MTSLSAYNDVRRLFETFLARGQETLRLDFPTPAKAIHYRQRAYTFRKKLQDATQAPTPYDDIIIRHQKGDKHLTVLLRPFEATITDLNGDPVEMVNLIPESQPETIDEDLARIAGDLRKKLL